MKKLNKAFTLIELLITVTIIAILASLIFGAARGMIKKAHQAKTAQNMRSVMNAMIQYSTDNGGKLPHSSWGGNPTNGPCWLYRSPNMTLPDHVKAGAPYPYLNDSQVFTSLMDKPTETQKTNRAMKLSSYSMNGAVINFGRMNVADYLSTYMINRFRADDVLLWEQEEGPSSFFFNDASNFPHEGLTERYGPGANVGCIDGSVQWMTRTEYYQLAAQNIRNRLWCNPGSSNGH